MEEEIQELAKQLVEKLKQYELLVFSRSLSDQPFPQPPKW
jgi:hypothetical protein